jgi:alpha-mannosidase
MPYSITGDSSVVLETVKFGEDDGTVLRLYEAMGATAKININADGEIVECNILEDEEKTFGSANAEITFAPFEIKTIKIK